MRKCFQSLYTRCKEFINFSWISSMVSRHNNVLMIGWEYPPNNSGGLGVACQGMTEALAGANTQIYFTLPYNIQKQIKHMKMLNCYDPAWQTDPSQPPFLAYASAVKKKTSKQVTAADLSTLPRSEIEMKVDRYADLVSEQTKSLSSDYDIIHAHDWMSFPAGIKVKDETKKPLVAHVHSSEYDRIPNGGGSDYIIRTERDGMRAADKIIAVSYYTKKLLVDKYNIDAKKIEVVYNGLTTFSSKVDKGSHHFASKRPVVVFMGRLTMQKGADYFIEVAKQVIEQKASTLFILAGRGDMYHELLFKTAASGLSASVLFSGFVRGKQKAKLLNRADVFIMPSLSEPFGLVAIEAAHHKIPVIISKNSGVGEIMKGSIPVDFWDIKKMSETVVKLLEDKGYSEQTVKDQLSDLKNVGWDQSAKQIKDVYNKTVSA